MKFFFGMSGNKDKKKSNPFSNRLGGKPAPEKTSEEKYKERLEERKTKMIQDIAEGKKNSFKLPGTKEDDKPKELSKGAKEMLNILAQKKVQKEMKAEQKKQYAEEREVKAKKNAELNLKKQQDAASQPAKSYFFGYTEE